VWGRWVLPSGLGGSSSSNCGKCVACQWDRWEVDRSQDKCIYHNGVRSTEYNCRPMLYMSSLRLVELNWILVSLNWDTSCTGYSEQSRYKRRSNLIHCVSTEYGEWYILYEHIPGLIRGKASSRTRAPGRVSLQPVSF
jgi:hypothetical protein